MATEVAPSTDSGNGNGEAKTTTPQDFSHLLVEFESQDELLKPIRQSARIKYSALDVSKEHIALGASTGSVYIFQRDNLNYILQLSGNNGSISKLLFSRRCDRLAVVTWDSLIVVWELNIQERKNPVQILTSTTHKDAGITCLAWDESGNRVFAGDERGWVTITNVDSKKPSGLFKLLSQVILKADSQIVQLDFVNDDLLVSTLTRIHVCFTKRKKCTTIGKKLREGFFGACFYRSSNGGREAVVLSARPGSRIWRSKFPRFLPEFPSTAQSLIFSKLWMISDHFILALASSGIYILDLENVQVILWTDSIKEYEKHVAKLEESNEPEDSVKLFRVLSELELTQGDTVSMASSHGSNDSGDVVRLESGIHVIRRRNESENSDEGHIPLTGAESCNQGQDLERAAGEDISGVVVSEFGANDEDEMDGDPVMTTDAVHKVEDERPPEAGHQDTEDVDRTVTNVLLSLKSQSSKPSVEVIGQRSPEVIGQRSPEVRNDMEMKHDGTDDVDKVTDSETVPSKGQTSGHTTKMKGQRSPEEEELRGLARGESIGSCASHVKHEKNGEINCNVTRNTENVTDDKADIPSDEKEEKEKLIKQDPSDNSADDNSCPDSLLQTDKPICERDGSSTFDLHNPQETESQGILETTAIQHEHNVTPEELSPEGDLSTKQTSSRDGRDPHAGMDSTKAVKNIFRSGAIYDEKIVNCEENMLRPRSESLASEPTENGDKGEVAAVGTDLKRDETILRTDVAGEQTSLWERSRGSEMMKMCSSQSPLKYHKSRLQMWFL
ncbi:hypothetical protein BSL78_29460 [Apostichopus japonicus]|uniref:HPS5-like beta-propeller domain-containing protein n=1 Tax=Stichopus japonicus TaxID=307972 RepID=A0A2G8JDA2_STIJA|nr:hypothetical protein BSL78_29460 [Apostichopus japonicus]